MPYTPTVYTSKAALLSSVEDRVYQNTTQLVTGEIHQQVEMDEVASMFRTAAAPLTLDTATGVMGLTAGLVAGNTYQWDGTAWGQVQAKTANIYWVDSVYGNDTTAQAANPFRAYKTFDAAAAAAINTSGTIQIRGSGSYVVSNTLVQNVNVEGRNATLIGDVRLYGSTVNLKEITGNVIIITSGVVVLNSDVTGNITCSSGSTTTYKGTLGGTATSGNSTFTANDSLINRFTSVGSSLADPIRSATFRNCTIGSRANALSGITATSAQNPGKNVYLAFCSVLSSGTYAIDSATTSGVLTIISDNSIAVPNMVSVEWSITSNYQRIGEP